MKQKVYVLGNGYIGKNLNQLNEGHYDVTVLNKDEHQYNHPEMFINILDQHKPDYIINACGFTGKPNVDACEGEKQYCWELNVNLPVTLSTICKSYGVPFIHVSSGCIYTGYEKEYTEQDTPNFGMGMKQSSWYSKTKHAAELAMKSSDAYIMRIRMPFCSKNTDRSILSKVLKYDKLIEYKNSMTSVEDFTTFIHNFLDRLRIDLNSLPWNRDIKPGIYNVCNPGTASLRDIVTIFKYHGVGNGDWKFVNIDKLKLKANRSNCVLDCTKIHKLGLSLPSIEVSLDNAIRLKCIDIITGKND
jgi:dTDP-4-dehydrorhamnose reductase